MPNFDWYLRLLLLSIDSYLVTKNTEELGVEDIVDVVGYPDFLRLYTNETTVFIAVRGSDAVEDWFSNAKAFFRDEWYGIRAHRGFVDGARSLAKGMIAEVEKHQDKHIVLTGHSRGGAIALLLAVAVEQEFGIVPECVTFGQPRVSTKTQIDSVFHGVYLRVVNGADIVTRFPKLLYTHAGDELYLTNQGAGWWYNPSTWDTSMNRLPSLFSHGRKHRGREYQEDLLAAKGWIAPQSLKEGVTK